MGLFVAAGVSCSWSVLYDVVMGCVKCSILDLQAQLKRIKNLKRDILQKRIAYMIENFGTDSERVADCIADLNNFDDQDLKARANKYQEFLLSNNEKPTRAFCLLGKENNLQDDICQIKKNCGSDFEHTEERKTFIREFYGQLYKKKMDNLIGIENFFLGGGVAYKLGKGENVVK